MTRPRHTGAGKIAAAARAPRPTGILPIHACMTNSDNEISDSEIISTGIPYSVPVYRYDELTAQIYSPVWRGSARLTARKKNEMSLKPATARPDLRIAQNAIHVHILKEHTLDA